MEKIPHCEKFGLNTPTHAAMIRTLRCHAALIEDLLLDNYKFVLTSRFQSDPLERRYGQYRQMSGGNFLVSLKEVLSSEDIIKTKSLLKQGLEIGELKEHSEISFNTLDDYVLEMDTDSITLCEESKEVAAYIAGYVAHKISRHFENCCGHLLVGESCENDRYLNMLSRGGLKTPSLSLFTYICNSFAVLDVSAEAIFRSGIPIRQGAEYILKQVVKPDRFSCDKDSDQACHKINRIVTNIFCNNKRKISTNSVITDRVHQFKRFKRTKIE